MCSLGVALLNGATPLPPEPNIFKPAPKRPEATTLLELVEARHIRSIPLANSVAGAVLLSGLSQAASIWRPRPAIYRFTRSAIAPTL